MKSVKIKIPKGIPVAIETRITLPRVSCNPKLIIIFKIEIVPNLMGMINPATKNEYRNADPLKECLARINAGKGCKDDDAKEGDEDNHKTI